ncbi:MAG: ABC transporter permease [Bacillota bacterium]
MTAYLARRAWQTVPLLLGISLVSFAVIHLAPGDPVGILAERTAPPEEVARVRAVYGLDRPIPVQYWMWLSRAVRGDFGRSYVEGRPVMDMILERLPNTLYLSVVVLLVVYVLAIPAGIVSALKQYSRMDHAVTGLAFWGQAMPSFWFAYLLVFFVALRVDFIPVAGMATYGVTLTTTGWWGVLVDRARYLILPVTVMGFGSMATVTRYMRSSMLEVVRQDYIRTARSKGLAERIVIYKHALGNALLPIVTLLGFELPILFSGSVIIEFIFSWPGVGTLALRAMFQRDYQVVMAFNTVGAVLMVLGHFISDILYLVVDPRIKYIEKG